LARLLVDSLALDGPHARLRHEPLLLGMPRGDGGWQRGGAVRHEHRGTCGSRPVLSSPAPRRRHGHPRRRRARGGGCRRGGGRVGRLGLGLDLGLDRGGRVEDTIGATRTRLLVEEGPGDERDAVEGECGLHLFGANYHAVDGEDRHCGERQHAECGAAGLCCAPCVDEEAEDERVEATLEGDARLVVVRAGVKSKIGW
jgi:hypothetical protein